MRSRGGVRAALFAAAAVTLLALPGVAAAQSPVHAARQALSYTDQRLSLMRSVMASKWVSRGPVEDRAQEARVLDGVRATARERGLAPATVAAVFRQEIDTAKTVELGWGNEWLLHGFPAGEPVPDLTQLRDELSALSARIVDALGGLDGLHCRPDARERLRRDSRRLVRTRFVTDRERTGLVHALLGVRPLHGGGC